MGGRRVHIVRIVSGDERLVHLGNFSDIIKFIKMIIVNTQGGIFH